MLAEEANLPPYIFAVPDVPTKVVFRNTDLIQSGDAFECARFNCAIGEVDAQQKQWHLIARDDQVGDYPFELNNQQTTLKVVPRNAGEGRKITLLVIGDSLTNASRYPNEIARLLSRPGNPEWQMLGTHQPASAAEKVFHEGYGGWTWSRFNSRWQPQSPQVGNTKSSPFLSWKQGAAQIDFERYFDQQTNGQKPDFVTILLGINDCFHANPDDPKAIESKINAMFIEADKFLDALHLASPETNIGICLTPPGNDRDSAFVANYKHKYTRWGWRKIQYRLAQRQIEHFGNREADNIFLVPTAAGIDPLSGYPKDNGVHPNQSGYETIGREIYTWLKWRLFVQSLTSDQPAN